MAGNQVRFRLGSYDHSRALIIDPVLSYASYLAGSATDHIGLATGPGIAQVGVSQGLAVDSAGSVYVAGYTYSLDFPTKNPYQSAPPAKQFGGVNVPPGQWPSAFVTKFSPDGSSLVYSTYLGGNNSDYIYAIAVDSSGSAYVTGQTSSASFPITSGAYQTVCARSQQYRAAAGRQLQFRQHFRICDQAEFHRNGPCLLDISGRLRLCVRNCHCRGWRRPRLHCRQRIEYCSTHRYQGCFPTTSGAVIGGNQPGRRLAPIRLRHGVQSGRLPTALFHHFRRLEWI